MNPGTLDLRLKKATQHGVDRIGSYLLNSIDLDGMTRGADGIWDRGAFEYVESDPPGPPGDFQLDY